MLRQWGAQAIDPGLAEVRVRHPLTDTVQCKDCVLLVVVRGVRIRGVSDQRGQGGNRSSVLRDSLQMVLLNLQVKDLGGHAAHIAERTSACCRTV